MPNPLDGFMKFMGGSGFGASPSGDDKMDIDDHKSSIRWSGYDSTSFRVQKNIQKTENVEEQIALVNRAGREQITSRPIDLGDDFVPPTYPKTEEQAEFLRKVLRDNFLFNAYSDKEMDMLIAAMQQENVPEGTIVIQQGDVGDYYYVVGSGKIEYLLDGASVGFATPGQGFGELALLYDAPRAVSCKAVEPTNLWRVDQKTFRTLLASQRQAGDDEIKGLINGIKLFEHLEESDKARFVNAMTTVVWKPNDRIVQKGSVGNVFYIVQEGQVKVHDIGIGSEFGEQTLGPGEFFGERALLTGEKRAANVTAVTEVKTLAMERETFEKAIGPLQMFLDMGMRRRFLQSIPMFADSDITELEMDQLVRLVDEVHYNENDVLVTEGNPIDLSLWIIRSGTLKVSGSADGKNRTLKSGDYFGDQFIVGDTQATASITAAVGEPLTTWVLQRKDIENVIGDIGRLTKGGRDREMKISYDFSELKRLKVLGKGAFGTVWLVKHGESAYALKEMSKRQLIDGDQVIGVKREKEMLLSLSHIFILSMIDWYQDDQKIYFLLPIVQGGELFSVVRTQKSRTQGLPNYNSAFYAAGIIEGLGYFHQRLIAYRDLKLENVLIDAEGYPVIVDLGFAKKVVDKTFTLCGTPEYLAPEIIMSKGHDKASDCWSYGCLLYELLVGTTPFYRPNSTQLDMFKRIVNKKYVMPDFIDEEASKLIRALLMRKPAQRLGNLSKGYLDVKSHDWFAKSGISFAALLSKKQKAPWKPQVKNIFDASNFDYFPEEPSQDEPLYPDEQELFVNF